MKRERRNEEPRRVHVGQHNDQYDQRPQNGYERNDQREQQEDANYEGDERGDYQDDTRREREDGGQRQSYGGERRGGERSYSDRQEATNDTEETDEADQDEEATDESREGEEQEAGWMARVKDLMTGKASDEDYEKATKIASLAIIGLFGLRRGGLLGGIIVAAAAGIAARTLGADMDMAEDEAGEEEEMQGEAA